MSGTGPGVKLPKGMMGDIERRTRGGSSSMIGDYRDDEERRRSEREGAREAETDILTGALGGRRSITHRKKELFHELEKRKRPMLPVPRKEFTALLESVYGVVCLARHADKSRIQLALTMYGVGDGKFVSWGKLMKERGPYELFQSYTEREYHRVLDEMIDEGLIDTLEEGKGGQEATVRRHSRHQEYGLSSELYIDLKRAVPMLFPNYIPLF